MQSDPTSRSHGRTIVLTILTVVLLAWGAWYTFSGVRDAHYPGPMRAETLRDLPDVPDLTDRVAELRKHIQDLDSRIRAEPGSIEDLAQLAMTYHAAERFTEAAACYRILQRLEPDNESWAYYEAVCLEAEFAFDPAIVLLRRVGEMKPDYPHVWARLGDLLRKQGSLEEARTMYHRAIELEPLHPNATLGLAYMDAKNQDWEKVALGLEPLVAENPLYAPAFRQLAHACRRLGREAPSIDMADPDAAMEDVINEPLLDSVYDYSVLTLLEGDADHGAEIVIDRCTDCHSTERIDEADKDAVDWRRTIRRMQSITGRASLPDQDAADILAFLLQREAAPPEDPEDVWDDEAWDETAWDEVSGEEAP